MLKSNTMVGYWTHLIPPHAWEMPAGVTVEAIPHPQGLFLTIEKNGADFSLTGRSIHHVSSRLSESLFRYLFSGQDVTAATIVLSHKILPETAGRGVLINALESDGVVDWDLFHTIVLDVTGNTTVKLPDWKPVATLDELNEFYQLQAKTPRSTGLMLRATTAAGEHFWYRRPLEYYLVAQFTNFDRHGNLYLRYDDPTTGIKYTGFFRKGEKTVIDDLLRNVKDPIGRYAAITVKSMTQTAADRVSMFGVRFETLVNKAPEQTEQFRLV